MSSALTRLFNCDDDEGGDNNEEGDDDDDGGVHSVPSESPMGSAHTVPSPACAQRLPTPECALSVL